MAHKCLILWIKSHWSHYVFVVVCSWQGQLGRKPFLPFILSHSLFISHSVQTELTFTTPIKYVLSWCSFSIDITRNQVYHSKGHWWGSGLEIIVHIYWNRNWWKIHRSFRIHEFYICSRKWSSYIISLTNRYLWRPLWWRIPLFLSTAMTIFALLSLCACSNVSTHGEHHKLNISPVGDFSRRE